MVPGRCCLCHGEGLGVRGGDRDEDGEMAKEKEEMAHGNGELDVDGVRWRGDVGSRSTGFFFLSTVGGGSKCGGISMCFC